MGGGAGGTWVLQGDLENFIGSTRLIELTDDSDDPGTLNSTVMGAAIDQAESELKAYLRRRYPSAIDAGTASHLVTMLGAKLAVGILSIRRTGIAPGLSVLADEARSALKDIRNGYLEVTEWESTATTDIVTTGKIEPLQTITGGGGDLYDYAVDSYRVPDEHDQDER